MELLNFKIQLSKELCYYLRFWELSGVLKSLISQVSLNILEGISFSEGTSRSECRDYRLRCSSAILAARSSYLRSLITRQQKSGGPLEIVINEHLFPRVYAHVVLHAVLTDQLDLTKVSFERSMVSDMCTFVVTWDEYFIADSGWMSSICKQLKWSSGNCFRTTTFRPLAARYWYLSHCAVFESSKTCLWYALVGGAVHARYITFFVSDQLLGQVFSMFSGQVIFGF